MKTENKNLENIQKIKFNYVINLALIMNKSRAKSRVGQEEG